MTAATGSSIDVKLKGRVSEKWRDGGNISAFDYICIFLCVSHPKYIIRTKVLDTTS